MTWLVSINKKFFTIRKLAATSLSFALLIQLASFGSSAQLVAQAQTNSPTTRKSSRKKKRPRAQSTIPAVVLPGVPLSSAVNHDTPRMSVAPVRPAKREVTTLSLRQDSDSSDIHSKQVQPDQTAIVNFRTLAAKAKGGKPRATVLQQDSAQLMPAPGTIEEVNESPQLSLQNNMTQSAISSPLDPSPAPATNFQGAIDEAIGGGPSGAFTIPPDTMGAVGIDKIISSVNNNVVIQDKASGAQLNVASLSSFWASTGASNVFD